MEFIRQIYDQAIQWLSRSIPNDQASFELYSAKIRFLIVVALIIGMAAIGSAIFEPLGPVLIAHQLQENIPTLQIIPDWIIAAIVPIFTVGYWRYILPPLGAVIFLLIWGTMYVQQIYELKSFRKALSYVLASMFGFNYPSIKIDGGKVQRNGDDVNVLDLIGGPGFALIQPGNAVMFRSIDGPTQASVTRSYFMEPFEQIGLVTSLDEQHDYIEKAACLSKDGIRCVVRNIHIRFRIARAQKDGKPVPRSMANPYPYSEEAMRRMAFEISIGEKGKDPWNMSIRRVVVGEITTFVNAHEIDYLTAPRGYDQDPRAEMKRELFGEEVGKKLANIGAELLWVDIGHIDIVEEDVDEQRLGLWQAELIGNANVVRALGEAKRLAYEEMARSEAQAEMIVSITQALQGIDLGTDPAATIRRILLVRTAQYLDGLRDRTRKEIG